MTAASALLREVRGVGLSVRLDGGRLLAAANSPPELLARLREHKAEIVEILKSDRCRLVRRAPGLARPRGRRARRWLGGVHAVCRP